MIRIIKAIITFLGTMFLGMYGGQRQKSARRFGIAGLSVAMDWKRGWPMIFLIPILIAGYGENSILMQHIGNETLVRLTYAFLLAIPFALYGLLRVISAFILLGIAFQVRSGSLGHLDWFGDILIEDMFRYGTLGSLIAFNLFWYKK